MLYQTLAIAEPPWCPNSTRRHVWPLRSPGKAGARMLGTIPRWRRHAFRPTTREPSRRTSTAWTRTSTGPCSFRVASAATSVLKVPQMTMSPTTRAQCLPLEGYCTRGTGKMAIDTRTRTTTSSRGLRRTGEPGRRGSFVTVERDEQSLLVFS